MLPAGFLYAGPRLAEGPAGRADPEAGPGAAGQHERERRPAARDHAVTSASAPRPMAAEAAATPSAASGHAASFMIAPLRSLPSAPRLAQQAAARQPDATASRPSGSGLTAATPGPRRPRARAQPPAPRSGPGRPGRRAAPAPRTRRGDRGPAPGRSRTRRWSR